MVPGWLGPNGYGKMNQEEDSDTNPLYPFSIFPRGDVHNYLQTRFYLRTPAAVAGDDPAKSPDLDCPPTRPRRAHDGFTYGA